MTPTDWKVLGVIALVALWLWFIVWCIGDMYGD